MVKGAGKPLTIASPPEPCVPQLDLALQGNLFGEPEVPAGSSTPATSASEGAALDEASLDDDALAADARSRPRQRIDAEGSVTGSAPSDAQPPEADATDSSSDGGDDLPAWSHHNLVDPAQLTPMLRHYVELKAAHPERVLLYRLGDFFECFFEDAIELSRLLELTLTGKEGGKAIGRVPMAGIPHHAAERYCADLIRKGRSVALCDQLEAAPAKGSAKGTLLKRDITRVLTPGTVLEEGMLSARRNNWLAAVVVEPAQGKQPLRWGLASADVSTGEVQVMQRDDSSALHQQLAQQEASELLWAAALDAERPAWCPERLRLTPMASTPFSPAEAERTLQQHYGLSSLDGLGLPEHPLALQALGGLLRYLQDTQPLEEDSHIPLEVPTIVHRGDALVLDAQTRRNLELTATQRDNQLQGSLLWAIDRTLTAMGGRCLRRWLEAPLMDRQAIQQRQDLVSSLVNERSLRLAIRQLLRPMGDLERLAGRAGAGHAGARDLVAIADGLERLPQLTARLDSAISAGPEWLQQLLSPDPALSWPGRFATSWWRPQRSPSLRAI